MSRKADIVTQPEESKLESLDAEEIRSEKGYQYYRDHFTFKCHECGCPMILTKSSKKYTAYYFRHNESDPEKRFSNCKDYKQGIKKLSRSSVAVGDKVFDPFKKTNPTATTTSATHASRVSNLSDSDEDENEENTYDQRKNSKYYKLEALYYGLKDSPSYAECKINDIHGKIRSYRVGDTLIDGETYERLSDINMSDPHVFTCRVISQPERNAIAQQLKNMGDRYFNNHIFLKASYSVENSNTKPVYIVFNLYPKERSEYFDEYNAKKEKFGGTVDIVVFSTRSKLIYDENDKAIVDITVYDTPRYCFVPASEI